MSPSITRTASAVLLVVCMACTSGEDSDPRLNQLTVGISRDSALRIVGAGAPADDSLPNVYRHEQYLVNGTPLEILFYSPDGLKQGRDSAPPESSLRPIVLQLGRVTGWGWAHFDSVARVHDIRTRVR